MSHSKWTLIMSMQTIYGCLSPPERLGMLRWGADVYKRQRLRRPVEIAAEKLTVREGRDFTPAHRRLWPGS